MVTIKKASPVEAPAVEEGWWESVLAEEGRHVQPGPKPAARAGRKPESPPKSAPDWAQVQELYREDRIVSLQVTGSNRGGLLVEGDRIQGFVPFSHLVEPAGDCETMPREKLLEKYIGQSLRLKVIECVPEDGRAVFSQRAALSEPGKRSELFHSLQPAQRLVGRVTNLTDFGAFVDLGGAEGLIHISELSWGRVTHPSHVLKMGQEVEVLVLELIPERSRVALSLKRLLPNPWEYAGSELAEGHVVTATITSIVSYGAFARLESGVEGLIHASEIPLEEGRAVKDFLYEGQSVQARVLHLDARHQRLGLSLKI
jgi:small subunit ribosomal protein S1